MLTVIYRACSTGNPDKIRPIQDKYDLVKTCFNSMLRAFGGVEYKLIVLLDKPTNEFRDIFNCMSLDGYEETFYIDWNEGNVKSFHRQLDIARSGLELRGRGEFLLVEDDYYFLPGSGTIISKAVKELPFITPYDHPGYYSEKTHHYKKDVVIAGGHHWMNVISTTLTFGGQCSYLRKEIDTMKKYAWADHPMWCDVTKRIPLYAPIPSLATHMETQYLAPVIDWKF